jgi:hypothetical protein
LADAIRDRAQSIESAELPDLRRVGIGWSKDGCEIDLGGIYVFQMRRDERHVIEILHALALGLFESRRDSSNSGDSKALTEVRGILQSVGETILRPPQQCCPKCNGLQHICVACDGECKFSYGQDHDRTSALCPECSAWLAPRAPR